MSMTPKRESLVAMYVADFIFSVALTRLSVHSRQLVLSPISQINTFYNFRHHTQTATLSDIYMYIYLLCSYILHQRHQLNNSRPTIIHLWMKQKEKLS